ncbi:MAG: ATP-binding protein, partial [Gemmatimonadaceae bacterium]
YGPSGQTIRVTLGAVGDRALLVVEDEGPGIHQDERERIWAPFYRLPADAEGSIGGSGIGLSVVRDLAERMGGHAYVTGRSNRAQSGARFVVELHAERERSATLATATPASTPST